MSRSYAVFDIDGTIFRSSLFIEVVNALIDQGTMPKTASHEYEAAYEAWRNRTHSSAYRDYVASLVVVYEKHLPKIKPEELEYAAEAVVKQQKRYTYVYTRDLIKKLKRKGYFLIAISGSQAELVARFSAHYGFDDFIGQEHEVSGPTFSGKSRKTHKQKGRLLASMVEKHNLEYIHSIAVGDSEGDVELLKSVEHPIAFNPERELFNLAKRKHWQIVVERKNMIYSLEYRDGAYVLAETDA